MTYVITAAGLAILLVGGEALVRGSVGLARALGIPPLLIGLTIVAFGTSAPELFVSINAARDGFPGLAIGNIVGSNIANVWLVLGAAAVLAPVPCDQHGIRRNVVMMIGTSILFIALSSTGTIGLLSGIVLFSLVLLFLGYSAYSGLKERANGNGAVDALEDLAPASSPIWIDGVWIAAGLIGLPVGAHLMVKGAEEIAVTFGVSDALIGLTIVAVGTSLPELATTVIAAARRHTEVAIGNVVGSNLFNILAIGGLTAIIVPVPVPPIFMRLDYWVMLLAALSIVPFVLSRRPIVRPFGIVFLAAYIAYIAAIVHLHSHP